MRLKIVAGIIAVAATFGSGFYAGRHTAKPSVITEYREKVRYIRVRQQAAISHTVREISEAPSGAKVTIIRTDRASTSATNTNVIKSDSFKLSEVPASSWRVSAGLGLQLGHLQSPLYSIGVSHHLLGPLWTDVGILTPGISVKGATATLGLSLQF